MRKEPRQKRSREMVSRLLDAAAVTIAERGLADATTNHIAEQAGVSIGSLYQYFPDKDAMVEALLERMAAEVSQRFRRQAEAVDFSGLALRDVASLAISYGMNSMKADPLVRELVQNWNRIPVRKLLDPLEQFFLVMAQPYFLRRYHDVPIQHLEAKLFVLINSVLFTCIHYQKQDNPVVGEAQLIHTLTDMIVGLLEGSGLNG